MDALERAEKALTAGTLVAVRPQDIRAGDVILNEGPEPLVVTQDAWLFRVGVSVYEVAVLVQGELRRLVDTRAASCLVERTTQNG